MHFILSWVWHISSLHSFFLFLWWWVVFCCSLCIKHPNLFGKSEKLDVSWDRGLYDSNMTVAFRRPRPEWLAQQSFVIQVCRSKLLIFFYFPTLLCFPWNFVFEVAVYGVLSIQRRYRRAWKKGKENPQKWRKIENMWKGKWERRKVTSSIWYLQEKSDIFFPWRREWVESILSSNRRKMGQWSPFLLQSKGRWIKK